MGDHTLPQGSETCPCSAGERPCSCSTTIRSDGHVSPANSQQLSRETLVSCRVNNVELDGLLRSILKPAGLGFTKEGDRVEIFALP